MPSPAAQQPADPLIAEFLGDVDWVPHNKANATSALNRWSRWLAGRQIGLLDVARRDVRAYLDERRPLVEPSTLRADWRFLRAFYRWAATPVPDGGGGELERDPMAG